ncbi:MAG: putative sulfate exporter family transporter [Glaciihabitans sp.]|nr:putative sulfate exporter family transporter [Glaciihabitans sp.]
MTASESRGPAARKTIAGLGLAAAGSAAGYGVSVLIPGFPWLTASLILGVVLGCIPAMRPALDGVLKAGLAVAARRLLRLGIVVLGLQVSLETIGRLGWVTILAIVALVGVSFVITWLIGRLFRLEGDQAVLLAAGFSICGVSAVGAMSAARGSDPKDAGTPTALVTLYGTAAIVILPALASLFGLDSVQFGHWVGASVHDVGQVVATAQTLGAAALAAAVVVKLTRVLMLAPMVAIASIVTRRRGTAVGKQPPIVPLFIIGFLVFVLVRTFIPVPDAVLATAGIVQSILLSMALFAIGASLRLEQLARSGARALAAGATSWIVILALGLGIVWLA